MIEPTKKDIGRLVTTRREGWDEGTATLTGFTKDYIFTTQDVNAGKMRDSEVWPRSGVGCSVEWAS